MIFRDLISDAPFTPPGVLLPPRGHPLLNPEIDTVWRLGRSARKMQQSGQARGRKARLPIINRLSANVRDLAGWANIFSRLPSLKQEPTRVGRGTRKVGSVCAHSGLSYPFSHIFTTVCHALVTPHHRVE
jgi:hypothetical protein